MTPLPTFPASRAPVNAAGAPLTAPVIRHACRWLRTFTIQRHVDGSWSVRFPTRDLTPATAQRFVDALAPVVAGRLTRDGWRVDVQAGGPVLPRASAQCEPYVYLHLTHP